MCRVCVAGDRRQPPRPDPERLRSGARLPHRSHRLQVPGDQDEDRSPLRQGPRDEPVLYQIRRRRHRRHGAAEGDVRRVVRRVPRPRALRGARHASDGGGRRHQERDKARPGCRQADQVGAEGDQEEVMSGCVVLPCMWLLRAAHPRCRRSSPLGGGDGAPPERRRWRSATHLVSTHIISPVHLVAELDVSPQGIPADSAVAAGCR